MMELVIKIPEEEYNTGQLVHYFGCYSDKLESVIYNGTPLSEHHGRLIECEPIYDELIRSYRADEKDYPERGKDYRVGLSNAIDLLIKAPTIIEGSDADAKESKSND